MPSTSHLVITDFDFEPTRPLEAGLSINDNEVDDRRLIRFSYPGRNHRRKQQQYLQTYQPPKSVSIFEKSPLEHIEVAANDRLQRTLLPPHITHGIRPADPPEEGCIHLLFWTSLERMKCLQADPTKADLSAEVYLEPDGSLDLKQVAATWGLENVLVIDPVREKLFEPTDCNWLSAIAVQNLSLKSEMLFLTERPSNATVTIRERRKKYLDNPMFKLWNWFIGEAVTHSRFDDLSHKKLHGNTLFMNIGVTLTVTHRWFTQQSIEQPPTWIKNICTGVFLCIVAIYMTLVVNQDFYTWSETQDIDY